jgi:hypothetical protein
MGTLTVRDVTDKQLEDFKRFSGQKTATKAILQTADKALLLADALEKANKLIEGLTQELEVRKQLINQLTPLCLQVAELSGQEDLFND